MAEPDGVIGHAEVRIGDSMLELSDGGEAWPPRPAAIHVYVPDADATYARAVAAGARSLIAPMDMPYGDREADVTDPFGNNWYIGTRKEGGPVPAGLRHAHAHPARGGHRPPDRLHQAGLRSGGARPHARAGRRGGARPAQAGRLGAGAGRGTRLRAADALLRSTTTWRTWTASTRARSRAGATTLGAPSDRPYGDRAAEVADPFGNHWFIATHIEDVPYR